MTTEALASSLCCCSYYNESFSALVLDDLLQQTATHASNELKQSYKVLTDIMVRGHVVVSVSLWFASKGCMQLLVFGLLWTPLSYKAVPVTGLPLGYYVVP